MTSTGEVLREIDARELGEQIGELIADVRHIKETTDRQQAAIKSIEKKLDEHIAQGHKGVLSSKAIRIAVFVVLLLLCIFEFLSVEYVGLLIKLIGTNQAASFVEWGVP
jgi:hypothetical protein